jgi:hypothetical protein
VKILRHERSKSSTVVYLEKDDGEVHAHCIMDGILEDRQEAWELPDDVDPIDLVLVEAHYEAEAMPSPFEGDFVTNREKVLGLVKRHKNKMTGDKKGLRESCQLPEEIRGKVRKQLREEFSASRRQFPAGTGSMIDSRQRVNKTTKDIRLGFDRLAEERLADDIISDNPELKRAPRVQSDEPVELSVKFI